MVNKVKSKVAIDICYLCDKQLDDTATPDHIIPDHLFEKGDPSRPQLPVHARCNNDKSKDDYWFAYQIFMHSASNKEAKKRLTSMMDKAFAEKNDAYIIGKKPRNLIFALGLLDELRWGLEYPQIREDLIQIDLGEKTSMRLTNYIKNLCKGLFIYNQPDAKPQLPRVVIEHYKTAQLHNRKDKFTSIVNNIWEMSKQGAFGQHWKDRILYFGNRTIEYPDKGVIFVEFYKQIGILAFFK